MKKSNNFYKRNGRNISIAFYTILLCMGMYSCTKVTNPKDTIETQSEDRSLSRVRDYTLKSVSDFTVGVQDDFDNYDPFPAVQNLIKKEYGRLTTQTLKMGDLYYDSASINYFSLDREINFAKNNNLKVYGHALVYYLASPDWVKNISNKNTLIYYTKNYIQNVIRHIDGNVEGVDVLNELFESATANWDGSSENNILKWRNFFGSNDEFKHFIGNCFKWARDADNEKNGINIKLFYNDYGHELHPLKRKGIFDLCIWLRDHNYPIDGIGMQFHLTVNSYTQPDGYTFPATTLSGITNAIADANKLRDKFGKSFLIHISEVDVTMDDFRQPASSPAPQKYADQWKQYDLVRHVVAEYRKIVTTNQKWGITMWNSSDKSSWINTYLNDNDFPTLFDANQNRKIMYYGFLSGANANNQYYIPENNFHLKNAGSGKFAEVVNGATTNSALIKQNLFQNSDYQKFSLIYNNNGFYQIKNIKSGKSFDHYSTTPFYLQQYTYGGGDNQQFSLEGAGGGKFRITSKLDNTKSLEVPSIGIAAQVQLKSTVSSNGFQYWILGE
jgi:endo-1,4-beta-xylanase